MLPSSQHPSSFALRSRLSHLCFFSFFLPPLPPSRCSLVSSFFPLFSDSFFPALTFLADTASSFCGTADSDYQHQSSTDRDEKERLSSPSFFFQSSSPAHALSSPRVLLLLLLQTNHLSVVHFLPQVLPPHLLPLCLLSTIRVSHPLFFSDISTSILSLNALFLSRFNT